jgi:membrane fusion protein, heavy metal efflux system
MEYPALVVGQTGRFAVHFTNLRTFKPATEARVVVELLGGGSTDRFIADPQTRPGIFGVNVTPKTAGSVAMSVRIESPALTDAIAIGDVNVYPDAEHAAQAAAPEPTEERIAFLKEQQWALDYGTALAETRRLQSSFLVPAEVIPRSGGSAEVTVPFSGRLVASSLPVIGSRVTQGQVLAELLPPTSAPSDLASIESTQIQATAELTLARRDRERAERLVAVGAAPAKRLDEARTAEATAEARLEAANARLGQYDTSSTAEGLATGARLFALRAPISGTIAQAHAAPGANIEAGEVLFEIVDLDTVYVSAIVPESEFPRISALSGAELEIPGVQQPRRLQRLISVGQVVDPASRTFLVIYEVDNRNRRVAVNQTVHVRLLTGAAASAVVVPESAIVDDAGRPIVFVQAEGESFVRKPVTLGVQEGGFVQVLEGLQSGERVVTRGANLIRLASMSSQVPAHGHVH